MIFSVNQNKHFYVGTPTVKVNQEGTESVVTTEGADGKLRSDVFVKGQIMSDKTIKVSDLVAPAKKYTYKVTPLDAEHYEDVVKVVVRKAYANDDNSKLVLYTSKQELKDIADAEKPEKKDFDQKEINMVAKLSLNGEKFVLEPKATRWSRGITYGEAFYDVYLEFPEAKVDVETETVTGDVREGTALNPAHALADLEYFCLGERGVDNREGNVRLGVPPAKYLIDPTADYSNKYLKCVHHYFEGTNGHKSEKDVYFLVDKETGFDLFTATVKE